MKSPFYLLLIFAVSGVSIRAQYTTSKIVFKNHGPYKQADLEATAGMHGGQKFATADLQAAAQRLSDSGFFEDVSVEVAGSNAAAEVDFILKPVDAQHLTAVGFENFVWLSPEELTAVLHKAEPLFHGFLSDAGNAADKMNAALTAAVAAKGTRVIVSHTTLEPSTTQPIRAIEFRVEQPAVIVRSVTVQSVSPAMADAVNAVAAKLKGTLYNEGLAGGTTKDLLLVPYSQDGYLDAKVVAIRPSMPTADPTSPGVLDVDALVTVDEGDQYRVASLDFAGTPIAPAALLTASPKLHVGDVASRKALLATLGPVDAAYRRLGYMDVVVDPGAVLDRAAHKVGYTVTVIPGEQYRVRNVTAIGLDPAAAADFDRSWLMKAGQPYNAEYVSGFIKNNSAIKSLAPYSATFKASADPQTHLVDLTLTFFRGGLRR